jgi:hypothetical protein
MSYIVFTTTKQICHFDAEWDGNLTTNFPKLIECVIKCLAASKVIVTTTPFDFIYPCSSSSTKSNYSYQDMLKVSFHLWKTVVS